MYLGAKIGTTQQRPEYSIPGNGSLIKMATRYVFAAIAGRTDNSRGRPSPGRILRRRGTSVRNYRQNQNHLVPHTPLIHPAPGAVELVPHHSP